MYNCVSLLKRESCTKKWEKREWKKKKTPKMLILLLFIHLQRPFSLHPLSLSFASTCALHSSPTPPPLQAWVGCEPPVILAQLTSLFFFFFHSLNLHLLFLTSVLFFFFSSLFIFFYCCYWFLLRCFLFFFFLSVFLVSLAALVRGLLSLYSVVAIIPRSFLVSRKITKQKHRHTHRKKKKTHTF